ncbi:hypothetical protein BH10PSE3_BH10PSE3_41050 [soil metagenome]
MSSLAEFIAAIMVWLSSVALCQFGMVVEHQVKIPPKAERVIARTPRQQAVQSLERCPRRHAVSVNA